MATTSTPAADSAVVPMDDVEIFAVGNWLAGNGDQPEVWTEADLKQAVKNFYLLAGGDKPLHVPKIKRGHIPDVGAPALGWVKELKSGDGLLHADFAKMPTSIFQEIKDGRLLAVSAEIDREPSANLLEAARQRGIELTGPVLKAVALLGAEDPAVKGLKPLAVTRKHSEANGKHKLRIASTVLSNGITRTFAEAAPGVSTMTREEMIAYLTDAGIPAGVLTDATTDADLQALVDFCKSKEKPAEMSDPTKTPVTSPATPPAPNSVTYKYSDADVQRIVKTAIGPLSAQLGILERRTETANQASAKKTKEDTDSMTRAFCERMASKEVRKLTAADLDETCEHSTIRVLLATPHEKTHTFSEGGKTVSKSLLELAKENIEARKPHMFAEKIQAGAGQGDVYAKIRADAVASRTGQTNGKSLHDRLGLMPSRGMR